MSEETRYVSDDGEQLPAKAVEAVSDPKAMRELLGEEVGGTFTLRSVIPHLSRKFGISNDQQRVFFAALRSGMHELSACDAAGIDRDLFTKVRNRSPLFYRAIAVHKSGGVQQLHNALLKSALGLATEVTSKRGERNGIEYFEETEKTLAPNPKALQMLLKAMGAPGFTEQTGPRSIEINFNMGANSFPEKGQHFDPALLPACGERTIPNLIDAEVDEPSVEE